ncbi:MAG TPA: ATP synthase F1 subunit delta [Planctomycetota bacterium]|nr:ATP synthase F1 subunit delta [Planctomycetota bacterium]
MPAKIESVAETYAQALLEAAVAKGVLEEVREEAEVFAKLLDEDRSVRIFIENPRVEKKAKLESIERALRGKVSDVLVNFLLVVVRKGRQLIVRDALSAFQALYDKHVGIVRAEAVSAVPMTSEAVDALKSRMSQELGKRVEVTNKIDPGVLAGLVVRYDGRVADGSVRSALAELRSKLSRLKLSSQLVHEDQS